MDIDGDQAPGPSWLHAGAAGQDMGKGNSSQLSPEDEELLALAAVPASQPQAGYSAAAPPPEELSQISPEDEELLALAAAPLSPAAEEHLPALQLAAAEAEGPSQISPKDEEPLALAAETMAHPEDARAAADAACAQPSQEPSQLDAEDEELLALAGMLPSQPAAGASGAQPAEAPSQLSPEDKELLALADAPQHQPVRHPAAAAAAEQPLGIDGTQSSHLGESAQLPASTSPTQASSLKPPVGCSSAQQAGEALQLRAGAQCDVQPESAAVHASMGTDDEELMSMAQNCGPSQRADVVSHPDGNSSGDVPVSGETLPDE